jgi:hypothetical protein
MYRAPIDVVAMLLEAPKPAPESERDVIRRVRGEHAAAVTPSQVITLPSAGRARMGLRRVLSRGH